MVIEELIFCSDECISDIRGDIIIFHTFTYQVCSQRTEGFAGTKGDRCTFCHLRQCRFHFVSRLDLFIIDKGSEVPGADAEDKYADKRKGEEEEEKNNQYRNIRSKECNSCWRHGPLRTVTYIIYICYE